MGEITDYQGKLTIGHNVQIGYFAQNQAQMLNESLTVFDTIDRVAVGDIRLKIRDILGAFMFGGEASDKKVKVLLPRANVMADSPATRACDATVAAATPYSSYLPTSRKSSPI